MQWTLCPQASIAYLAATSRILEGNCLGDLVDAPAFQCGVTQRTSLGVHALVERLVDGDGNSQNQAEISGLKGSC